MSDQERDEGTEQDRLVPELGDEDISAEFAADIAAGYGQERMTPDEFFAEIDRSRQDITLTVVYEHGEDGWIMAQVTEVPAAISQGRTREEARANVLDALQLALASQQAVPGARAGIAPGSPVVVETDGENQLRVREQTSAEMDAEVAAGGLARRRSRSSSASSTRTSGAHLRLAQRFDAEDCPTALLTRPSSGRSSPTACPSRSSRSRAWWAACLALGLARLRSSDQRSSSKTTRTRPGPGLRATYCSSSDGSIGPCSAVICARVAGASPRRWRLAAAGVSGLSSSLPSASSCSTS